MFFSRRVGGVSGYGLSIRQHIQYQLQFPKKHVALSEMWRRIISVGSDTCGNLKTSRKKTWPVEWHVHPGRLAAGTPTKRRFGRWFSFSIGWFLGSMVIFRVYLKPYAQAKIDHSSVKNQKNVWKIVPLDFYVQGKPMVNSPLIGPCLLGGGVFPWVQLGDFLVPCYPKNIQGHEARLRIRVSFTFGMTGGCLLRDVLLVLDVNGL